MSRLIILIILIPIVCYSAPASVTLPDSSVDDGDTGVIINGTGFGSNALDLEWTGANIDAGTPGNGFSKSGWTVWAEASTNAEVKYSNARSRSGNNSLLQHFYDADYDSKFSFYTGPEDQFYITFWLYQDKTDDCTTFQWKHCYVHADNTISPIVSGFRGAIWWYGENWGNNWCIRLCGSNTVVGGPNSNAYNSFGSWMRIEYYLQKASSVGGSDGVYQWNRVDHPSYAQNITGITTHTSCDTDWQYVFPSFYYGNRSGYTTVRDMDMYIDDIYISDTRARVEIGNASTWSACTVREIQIPTSWSSTQIAFTVNQGGFANGTYYVYVVDDDGAYNSSGTAITFETSGGSDTSPPWIGNYVPADEAVDQANDSGIQFTLADNVESDLEDLAVTINETVHCWDDKSADCDGGSGIKDLADSGSATNYTISWTNTGTWSYGQEINITIYAEDTSDNSIQETISYTVMSQPDTDPPYLNGLDPEDNETDVPPNTNMVAIINDGGNGVDIDTIEWEIKSTVHCWESLSSDCDGGSGIKDLVITGGLTSYVVTYNPETDFLYDEEVSWTFNASDLTGTPNAMSEESGSFTIMSEPFSDAKKISVGGSTVITVGNNIEITIN